MIKKYQESVCRYIQILRRASLTLECAFILPLYLMACLTLVSFMDAVRIQTESSLDLSNRARQLAAAGGLTGGTGDGMWVDLSLPKTYRYPFSLFGVPSLRMAVRARVYTWVGCANGIGVDPEGNIDPSDDVVYVTDNEEVYHTDPNCTHIDLAVYRTTTSEIKYMRNAYGSRYRKCSGFPKNYSGEVYYSAKGNYYYPSADYGGITRNVHIVPRSSTSSLPPCSRCSHPSGS